MSEQNNNSTPLPAGKAGATSMVQLIQTTEPLKLASLEIVHKRFVENYNLTNVNKMGEIEYQRQMIYFNQAMSGNDKLRNADRMSQYGAFMALAINGYDLDPQAKQVYLLAIDGKAVVWPQAPAQIAKLINRGTINYANQPKLVYRSELPSFKVSMGKVVAHEENFDVAENDTIVAAYIIYVLDEAGTEKHFIYKPADWEAWRKKSKQADGDNWKSKNGQPDPGFLRTKVVKHSATDPSWPTLKNPASEQFNSSVVDLDDEDVDIQNTVDDTSAVKPDNIQKVEPPKQTVQQQQNNQHQQPETIQAIDETEIDFTANKKAVGVTQIADDELDFSK